MGMTVNIPLAKKVLYGITCGYNNRKIQEITGFTLNYIQKIRRDPEKYKQAIQRQEEREEYIEKSGENLSYKERFAAEWERVVNRIRRYYGLGELKEGENYG